MRAVRTGGTFARRHTGGHEDPESARTLIESGELSLGRRLDWTTPLGAVAQLVRAPDS